VLELRAEAAGLGARVIVFPEVLRANHDAGL
jgi:hypothetical protein